jgi:transposase
MMGKKEKQRQRRIIDMDKMIPEKHLLKKINGAIEFDFIYEKAAPYYSEMGRPSIDPVSMIKMLLVGYLYGIKSERRLEEEITLNIAYRWFCGYEITDKIPDHSVFSQNRRRRFGDNELLIEIFNRIVRECVEKGIVSGKKVVSDGSFIPANVSEGSLIEMTQEVEKSTVRYLDALDAELRAQPGYKEPASVKEEKTVIKSETDVECGYCNQENKKGFGYLTEMTTDTGSGIILGVDCYAANQRESNIILNHIEKIQTNTGINIDKLALDAGYDVGAVHRGLELLGITGYVSCIEFSYDILKRDLIYLPEPDRFECKASKHLNFIKLTYKKSTQNYYRLYRMDRGDRNSCPSCKYRSQCAFSYGESRINVSAFYPAFYRNRIRYETPMYKAMKRLRGIWAEGTFAVLKREHNLNRAKMRGCDRMREQCLFSALALNLKRMVKALGRPKVVANMAVAVINFFGFFSFADNMNPRFTC